MTAKNKKNQKIISSLAIILLLVPAVLFSKPKQVEAVWWSTLLTDANTTFTSGTTATSATANTTSTAISIKNVAKEISRQILMHIAAKLLQEMTKSTVNWINSGFHGNPLFLENPDSFFKDIAKYEVRTMVDLFGYDPLRYPFGKDFALNTIGAYQRQLADNAAYSLSNVIKDPVLLKNYQNDFNVGGWNGFLINTQYPQNNYLGFQMLATEELARKLQGTTQNAAQKVQTTLQQGMGFLSPQTCPSNPAYNNAKNEFLQPKFDYAQYQKTHPYEPPSGTPEEIKAYDTIYMGRLNTAEREWGKTNYCPGGLVNTTPGSVVGNQVMTALGAGQHQTELASAMGNSISAVVDALLNHFLDKGLNALASKANPKVPTDTWSYDGQTLGTVTPYNSNTSWDSGPDQPIALADFRKAVSDGINNTTTELQLMDNGDANNPGIMQMLGLLWPKVRELDICLPGPDLGWQERTDKELQRNSGKLSEKVNDDDPDKAAAAQLSLNELQYAVNFYKDWVKNKIMTELPDATNYTDAVNDIKTYQQQADQLIDARKVKSEALTRLKSIKTELDAFTAQPAPGSAEEKNLIESKKKYDATVDAISNSATIEETRNQLSIDKDKLANLNKLVTQCGTERTAKGWANPGGPGSSLTGSGTEQALFCSLPVNNGYSHGPFQNPNSVPGAYTNLPLVNGKDVLNYTRWFSVFGFNLFGSHHVDITMECDLIFKANVLDYKGNLPGLTTVSEPYQDWTPGGESTPVPTSEITATGEITTATPTSVWTPTQTINGWFPALSPDGNYVSYGFGKAWVTDLTTKEERSFVDPDPSISNCFVMGWIKTDTYTYVCELSGNGPMARYEVKVGEWISRRTSDNPVLVGSFSNDAADGHWVAARNGIVVDNSTVVPASQNPGTTMTIISGNYFLYACNNNNDHSLCLSTLDGSSKKTFSTPGTATEADLKNNYILYAGSEKLHGITPAGVDSSKTIGAFGFEGKPVIFLVKGAVWIASSVEDYTTNKSYVILRPWNSKNAIVLDTGDTESGSAALDVVFDGTNFVVAQNTNKGMLTVSVLPENSPRNQF